MAVNEYPASTQCPMCQRGERCPENERLTRQPVGPYTEPEPTPEQERIRGMVTSATELLVDQDLAVREAIARMHTVPGDHWEPLHCGGCYKLEAYERQRRTLPRSVEDWKARDLMVMRMFRPGDLYYLYGQPDDGMCVPVATPEGRLTDPDPLTVGKRRGPRL
jgi:hypothetical protein